MRHHRAGEAPAAGGFDGACRRERIARAVVRAPEVPGAPTAVATTRESSPAKVSSGASRTSPSASASSPSARWRAEEAMPLPPEDSSRPPRIAGF